MRLAIAISFVLVLALSASAFADFTYVTSIPAPRPYPGCPVLGLASNGNALFATVASDTSQWFYMISPGTGFVLDSHEWNLHNQVWPRFEAACYEGASIYWVARNNGDLIRFEWVDGEVTPLDTLYESRITYPTGMDHLDAVEGLGDNLVADAEFDSAFVVGVFGGVSGAADLGPLSMSGFLGPTSISTYGGHHYFTSSEFPDSVFETDEAMARVGAHHLPIPVPFSPQAAAFFDGLYYVGGPGDSIYVYSFGSYADSVPEGLDITIEIVPEGLSISFDSVATAGSLFAREILDTCPAPDRVSFFGDFYQVSTTAEFDYIAMVEMLTNTPLPNDVMPRRVRVFKRPSGPCTSWRDITVEPIELYGPGEALTFVRLSRTLSEDDEFSVFTLGEDNRNPNFVIQLKYGNLEGAITSNADSIPNDTIEVLLSILSNSEAAYGARRYGQAARLADRIAVITRATPEIPHRYQPGTGRINVAGRIIARAHTLAFSLRQLIGEVPLGPGGAKSIGSNKAIQEPAPVGTLIAGPNPSATGFTIRLSGTAKHPVSVKIYSVEGELVTTLLEGGVVGGERTLAWNGRNRNGERVSAGTYFVVVTEGESVTASKVVLRK